jgi:ribonuclease HI
MSAPIVAYTDGGCRGNPGPGGWGFVLIHRASRACLRRCGGENHTTNNKMELLGAIMALRSLNQPGADVLLFSDSQYVVKAASEWLPGWKRRGWRRAEGELKNVELLQEIDRLMGLHRVSWRWVKGHAGDPGNEAADALTNRAMDAVASGIDADWSERSTWKGPLPT